MPVMHSSFVYEHPASGVLFNVAYTRVGGAEPEFQSVRVLDADYKPVGPELVDFMAEVCTYVHTDDSDVVTCTALLSAVAQELV